MHWLGLITLAGALCGGAVFNHTKDLTLAMGTWCAVSIALVVGVLMYATA